ncbi:uncharacterized protein K452DRAFT_165991 [Aplosporella prunicola CBS 121167]|uniref:Uncharacterized protein n=1 Tax=Aplosporella prunicola CBS 121167 TaxID=1176127 RepID=A0A6A6AWQ8_9PEZI|nr:uncharacterized protein K452DRAFT_165991 [Aplosporella prunicola CBS 121167]KAF2135698.1 hypothetical protein K452DRAFT_165991 [Aplosporella prunicola CBS 121167]
MRAVSEAWNDPWVMRSRARAPLDGRDLCVCSLWALMAGWDESRSHGAASIQHRSAIILRVYWKLRCAVACGLGGGDWAVPSPCCSGDSGRQGPRQPRRARACAGGHLKREQLLQLPPSGHDSTWRGPQSAEWDCPANASRWCLLAAQHALNAAQLSGEQSPDLTPCCCSGKPLAGCGKGYCSFGAARLLTPVHTAVRMRACVGEWLYF